MKKSLFPAGIILSTVFYFSFTGNLGKKPIGTYVGTQQCATCHSAIKTDWQTTLHSKIHSVPDSSTVRPSWTGSVSMGASYGNASVALVMNGSTYQAILTPSSGSPDTFDIAYTYGYGWKQRYLVKYENSYYIIPIQYNINKYLDNSSGTWATYNPQKWFTATGTLKPYDNSFRKNSWDKNCSSCHITGNDITKTINGNDTAWVSTWANSSSALNMTVGCEQCHGPGSIHAGSPDASNIYGPTQMSAAPLARQLEVCGQCHSRAASTGKTYEYPYNETTDSAYYPGEVLANYYTPWNTLFNQVGGPGVWPDTLTSRQHHQQWQDMSYSSHNSTMNCYFCHDPHKTTAFQHQLKEDPANNNVCLQCHNAFGTLNNPNITAITNHTKHPYDPTNQNQTGGASRCVKCHMATTATTAKAYDIHLHSWKVIPPSKTLEKRGITTPTLGMLNSCSVSCHRNPSTSNGTGSVPDFGIATDSTLSNWNQLSDSLLADTLDQWFSQQVWTLIRTVSDDAEEHLLGQNFPNPFLTKTQISFTVPEREHVTIKVFDLTGKEVYLLVDGTYGKGTYSVNFDVTNIGGQNTGYIFFYQITAGDYVALKKMISLR